MVSTRELITQFGPEVDGALDTVLTTAPARRWARLETMAEAGHTGAAGILGIKALEHAENTGPLSRWMGADTRSYAQAYENLRRYEELGGQVNVTDFVGRASSALPEDARNAIEQRVEQWANRHSPAPAAEQPSAEDSLPEETPEESLEESGEPILAAPEDGATMLDEITVSAADHDDEEADYQDYEVKRGDSLWKIAKAHYGLDDNVSDPAEKQAIRRDIASAVEKIAHFNGLENGTDANNLRIGQALKLPDSPLPGEEQTLDWAALDRDTAAKQSASARLQRNFESAGSGIELPSDNAPIPVQRPVLAASSGGADLSI
ncbi:MAG: LysM peptidoglycan-binding domain-containing protein [Micavibrio sp.]